MKAKPGELKAGWNARERDIGFAWGGDGATKPDSRLLYGALAYKDVFEGKTLVQELEARGYDLTTLRFSIRRKQQPMTVLSEIDIARLCGGKV